MCFCVHFLQIKHLCIVQIFRCVSSFFKYCYMFWKNTAFSSPSLLSHMFPPATDCVIHMIMYLIPYGQRCRVTWELNWWLSEGAEAEFLADIYRKKNFVSVSFTALIKGVVTVSYLWLCLLSLGVCVCVWQVSEAVLGFLIFALQIEYLSKLQPYTLTIYS